MARTFIPDSGMHEAINPHSTARLSVAFLAGATASAGASIAATLAIVPADLPGRAPSASELTVLAVWVLALALGHRWATRRHSEIPEAATLGATLRQAIWGGGAFLLLAALTLVVAPFLSVVAARLATATALVNAPVSLRLLLLIPLGVVLALGTGAATGSLVRPRA